MDDARLSRAELLSGGLNRSRRAARLLAAIEARCAYMRDESRRVVAAYLLDSGEDFRRRFDKNYMESLRLAASGAEPLVLDHLERFVAQWKPIVPPDPDLRARLLRLIGQKYGLGSATLAALLDGQQAVATAYQQIFSESPEVMSCAPANGPGKNRPAPAGAGPEAWQEVETRLEWLSLAGGETLFRAGDPGDALYVVISGRVRALVADEDGSERPVREIGRGELVGEMAVLTADPRSATVRAVRDSELVRLGRDDLLSLAQRHVEVLVRINSLIVRRLQKQYAEPGRTENSLLTFTLLPCDPSVRITDFGRRLAQAFAEYGPTTYVTCARVDEAIEPGASGIMLNDPRNGQVVAWLSELESRYRYVIYEAEPEASAWSRRCIRQADRILLVGTAAASPVPAAHEASLLAAEQAGPPGSYGLPRPFGRGPATQRSNRVELVLLHDPGPGYAVGTARWLAPRALRGHYHVRRGDAYAGDMAYLARCLTGHAFGLVLGGGGARGFAHVGVVRAIEEAGVPIDLVGGTSMGALITGGLGLGLDWRQMREIGARLSSPLTLFDPTLPVVSLFSSGKVTRVMQQVYGDVLIEDLWRPVFCVSSNLSRACETIYRQGPLWKAVRASLAIPGIFAPVLHDGDLQVDGAVMNNVPTDVMREPGQAGTVVTINVLPSDDLVQQYNFPPSISGPRAALSLVNPYDEVSVPLIYENLVRVMALHDVPAEKARRRLADIYITPAVERYNVLDFGSYDSIIEIGYRAAQDAFAAAGWQPRELTGRPVPAGAPGSMRQLENTLADLEKVLAGWSETGRPA